MNIDVKRYNRQLDVLRKWIAMGRVGTMEAVTGFGKTFTGILSIRHIRKYFGEEKVIVIVPSLFLKDQWIEKINENKLNNVEVYTVQSKPEGSCTLLILDEVHRYTGDEFKKIFDSIDYRFIFGLTATLDPRDDKFDIIRSKAPVCDTITTKEALENEWISDFNIYCLPVQIPESEKLQLSKINTQFNKFFSEFNFDFKQLQLCLKDIEYRTQYAKNLQKTPQEVQIFALNAMRIMRNRKAMLYNHPNKIEVVRQLVAKFNNKKIVIFSEDTKFADAIHHSIPGSLVYHSNLPTYLVDKKTNQIKGAIIKDGSNTIIKVDGKIVSVVPKTLKRLSKKNTALTIIDKFKNNESRVIVTARAFDEGVDIPDIDMTITAAGSSKARQSTQRRGRGLRKGSSDKIAISVELYIPDSQEFKWTQSRLMNIPNVQWVASIDEIE